MKRIGFLTFGHYQPGRNSAVSTARDAILQTIELAVAAEEIGLDRAKLVQMMNSDEVKATINEVYDLANKLNLTGTPSYATAKEVVVGAVGYDALKAKIAEARCAETQSC